MARRWLDEDIRYRFAIDAETRAWAQANGRPELEILRSDVRERFEREREQIKRRLAEIVTERGLEKRPKYPPLIEQADAVGDMIDYTLAYRLDSQSAAHPSAMALQNLIQELPNGGLRVLAEPAPGDRLNVQGAGAYHLWRALWMAGAMIPQLQLGGLDEIYATLVRISRRDEDASESGP